MDVTVVKVTNLILIHLDVDLILGYVQIFVETIVDVQEST